MQDGAGPHRFKFPVDAAINQGNHNDKADPDNPFPELVKLDQSVWKSEYHRLDHIADPESFIVLGELRFDKQPATEDDFLADGADGAEKFVENHPRCELCPPGEGVAEEINSLKDDIGVGDQADRQHVEEHFALESAEVEPHIPEWMPLEADEEKENKNHADGVDDVIHVVFVEIATQHCAQHNPANCQIDDEKPVIGDFE